MLVRLQRLGQTRTNHQARSKRWPGGLRREQRFWIRGRGGARFLLRELAALGQCKRHLFQPFWRQACGFAQVDPGQFPLGGAIGFPVPATALAPLLPRGEGAPITQEGEQAGRFQPGIPGRGADRDALVWRGSRHG